MILLLGIVSSLYQPILFTSCEDGFIRIWNTSTYSVLAKIKEKLIPTSISIIENNNNSHQNVSNNIDLNSIMVITGWNDGALRAYHSGNTSKLWEIPNCHRYIRY